MKKNNGQTILELIMAIGVVALIVTGLVVAVTASLRNSQAGRLRSTAVKYAQEGIELTRSLRDALVWDSFLTYTDVTPKQWCLDENGVFSVFDSGVSCSIIAGRYTRVVSFTWADPIVDVIVSVSWREGGNVFTSSLETHLTRWK